MSEQTNQLPLEQTAPQTEQPKAEAQTTAVAKKKSTLPNCALPQSVNCPHNFKG